MDEFAVKVLHQRTFGDTPQAHGDTTMPPTRSQALSALAAAVKMLAEAEAEELNGTAIEQNGSQDAPEVKVTHDEAGGVTYTLHTDDKGRTFHVLVREDGSTSFYFTVSGGGVHAVLHDTLDADAWCKADWGEAPEWATAHAVLPNGKHAWFEKNPTPLRDDNGDAWSARGGRAWVYDPQPPRCIWWRSSVTTRLSTNCAT